MKPATWNTGFFQRTPDTQKNSFETDYALQRTLAYFFAENQVRNATAMSSIEELRSLGARVMANEVMEWGEEAERNLPFINHQDAFGNNLNQLVTSEGWKRLKGFAAENGIVSTAYTREYGNVSRLVSFAKVFLFAPSSAMVSCPLAMTDGCARLMEVAGNTDEERQIFKHLISRNPKTAWMSGQWMTERPGGSDVSRSETVAKQQGDVSSPEYRVSGFKWFSSATDSEVSVILAHRVDSKGDAIDSGKLSCFVGFVKEENRVRLHRLKKKFGTWALPTAEIELDHVRSYLVGEPGKGVKNIAAVLNITRIYSSLGSLSYWRRALYIAKEYSMVRSVFGKTLCTTPAHIRILADQEIAIRGMMFLGFYAAHLMGHEETKTLQSKHELILLRLIPGLGKMYICKKAVSGVSECMEALGGVGYLEFDYRMNIARILRDVQVNAIWEGTTNVLADDLARMMAKTWKQSIDALTWLVDTKLRSYEKLNIAKQTHQRFNKWKSAMESKANNLESVRRVAREIMFELAEILIGVLAISDISLTNNLTIQDEIAQRVALVWTTGRAPQKFSTDHLIVYNCPPHDAKL